MVRETITKNRRNRGKTLNELRALEREHSKSLKRVKRLERDARTRKDAHSNDIYSLNCLLSESKSAFTSLQSENSALFYSLADANNQLSAKSTLVHDLREQIYALQKQVERSKSSLSSSRSSLKKLSVWNPMKGGAYIPKARKLFRILKQSGVRNCDLAVKAVAEALGVKVKRVMSRRTGSHCVKEGGIYGLLQLGREITNTPAFGESNDGTTMRRITQECQHITLPVPSYEPDANDDDSSTWTYTTHFAEAVPALDHTAKRQLEGSEQLGKKIADTYSNSPLAQRDGKKMDGDDYFWKQTFQNMDHASDGKKKFKLTDEKKAQILHRDLEDIVKAAKKTADELTTQERGAIAMDLLEQRIGKEAFKSLPDSEARLLRLFIFVGCGAHKSLNTFRYGVVEMRETWKRSEELKGPCDLANKSHELATKIASNNNDTEASDHCEKSCPQGGVKLCELAGALFQHKDGETGYQEQHHMFIKARKEDLYELPETESGKKFPDVSNTRYQSHSYAAAELLVFCDDYQELVEEICNGKTKQGTNHLEGNMLKGLQDPDTLAELGTMAIEGITTSWPYMSLIRSPPDGTNFVNTLSPEMIELHRNQIVPFCENLALHPEKILDPNTPQIELTLDGQPFIDETIIPALRTLAPELPNLNLMISAMFRCAAQGGLGSLCGYIKYTPSSDAHTFSSLARSKRNNLEAFISKLCQQDDQLYIMHLARELDASGEAKRFQEEYLRLQKERAELARKKVEDTARKKADELQQLNTIGIVVDQASIRKMMHKGIRHDPELANVTQSSLKNKQAWLDAILAAVKRIYKIMIEQAPQVHPWDLLKRYMEEHEDCMLWQGSKNRRSPFVKAALPTPTPLPVCLNTRCRKWSKGPSVNNMILNLYIRLVYSVFFFFFGIISVFYFLKPE
ncbi:hypothetical protein BT96DRAFT_947827 [Gymnopus androsaceus JB14]|uniref:Uncharacterized protein n=1 Tax=Gymnopus androsaceus JB14 TaxID=1447944 RepID=A0A6A4GQU4_9AGAR|nr:hypothetical protein BT96DRAFT_947827 [Gymnopus androsaceus JB14]